MEKGFDSPELKDSKLNVETVFVPYESWFKDLDKSPNYHVDRKFADTPIILDKLNPFGVSKILEEHIYNCKEELLDLNERYFTSSLLTLLPIYAEINTESGLSASCIAIVDEKKLYMGEYPFLDPNKVIMQITDLDKRNQLLVRMNVPLHGPGLYYKREREFLVWNKGRMVNIADRELRREIIEGFADMIDGNIYPFLLKSLMKMVA